MLLFPNIDPIMFTVGPLEIRWYGFAYMISFIIGYYFVKMLSRKYNYEDLTTSVLDSLATYCVLGVIIGGRVGYVVIYMPTIIVENPINILKAWDGGMSFHGGLIGIIIALYIISKIHKLNFFHITDLIACTAPIGLFFGRIANFINAELYGRISDVPWAVVFPGTSGAPRHPSQIYEALLEGVVLFFLLNLCFSYKAIRDRSGLTSGIFLILYALARSIVENYREPDSNIGFILENFTMGQLVTFPMFIIGGYIIWKNLLLKHKI